MYLFGVTSTNFSNLALMVVTCNLLHLACLPFLGMIPRNVEPTVRPEFRPRHQGNAEDGRLLFEAGDGGHQGGGLCAYILPDSALGFEQKVSHMVRPPTARHLNCLYMYVKLEMKDLIRHV